MIWALVCELWLTPISMTTLSAGRKNGAGLVHDSSSNHCSLFRFRTPKFILSCLSSLLALC